MEHKGTVQLETERLILRRFVPEDAEAFFRNWASDPEVARYLTWPAHESVAVTRRLLEEVWIPKYQRPDYYNWAIIWKETGEPIGNVEGFHLREDEGEITLGYCMSQSFWGRGIMPEAVREVMKFFFCQVGLNRIQADHDTRNPKSGRVMQKCGMQYEGTLRQKLMTGSSGLADVCVYGILKSEF